MLTAVTRYSEYHCKLSYTVVTTNFSNQMYETDENDGTVSVCLQKDIATAQDLLINIVARELDDEEAIGNTVNVLYGMHGLLDNISKLQAVACSISFVH